MSSLKGVDVLIKVKDNTQFVVVGGQQNGTLDLGLGTFDVTSKDSSGWEEVIAGIKNWGASLDGVVKLSNKGLSLLQKALFDGTEIDVEVAMGTTNKYSGKALVTSLSFDGPYDDAATFSISLKGTGELTPTPTPGTVAAEAANVKEAK